MKTKSFSVDLMSQVRAVADVDDQEAAGVSPRNAAGGLAGLRAYFSPITGGRRTGLVNLSAVRVREEGQVRTGDVTAHPDFAELVSSIREHGILQPVTLTWDEQRDCFWVDYGHRRVAAARAAGLSRIPAVITVGDGILVPGSLLTTQQLIENLQRTQLPPLDVAHALKRLADSGIGVSDLSRRLGKSKSWVSKHLKLLELPPHLLERAEREEAGPDLLYLVAQAKVPDEDRERLFDVAVQGGRDSLNKEFERLAVTTARSIDADSAEPAPSGSPQTPSAEASRKALLGAARRLTKAATHFDELLQRARDERAQEVHQCVSNLVAAVERFRNGDNGD